MYLPTLTLRLQAVVSLAKVQIVTMATRIIRENDSAAVVFQLSESLSRSQQDPRPVVLMICGIAGMIVALSK